MVGLRIFIACTVVLGAYGFFVHPSAPDEPAEPLAHLDVNAVLAEDGCVDRGRIVFFDRKRSRCSACHSIGEGLGLAGPDLASIGSRLEKRGLLQAILEPSADVPTHYHVYVFDDETQGLVIGVVSDENDEGIEVRNEAGEPIRLEPGDVFDVRKSNLSMMPHRLVEKITARELIDLLEFLASLRAGAAAPG